MTLTVTFSSGNAESTGDVLTGVPPGLCTGAHISRLAVLDVGNGNRGLHADMCQTGKIVFANDDFDPARASARRVNIARSLA